MSDSPVVLESLAGEELVIVFQGDLAHCRERLQILLEEGIPAQISGSEHAVVMEGVAPILQVEVRLKDLQEVADVFYDIWQETLEHEGFSSKQIEQIEKDVIDFSQDTIVCPGCQNEIDAVTEDGECIECGLFLGLPEDDEDDDETDE